MPPERGFAMAALLVAMTVMAIMMGVLLPAWRTQVQREREAELVFRGQQYVQAIELYSRRYGGFPTSLDSLTSQNNRFLRKVYKDPVTGEDFQLVYFGQVALAPPAQAGQPGQAGRGAAAPARGAPAPGPPAPPQVRRAGPGALAFRVPGWRHGQVSECLHHDLLQEPARQRERPLAGWPPSRQTAIRCSALARYRDAVTAPCSC